MYWSRWIYRIVVLAGFALAAGAGSKWGITD